MWRVPGLHLHLESDRGTAIFTPLFLDRRGHPAALVCTLAARRYRLYHFGSNNLALVARKEAIPLSASVSPPNCQPADSLLSCLHNDLIQQLRSQCSPTGVGNVITRFFILSHRSPCPGAAEIMGSPDLMHLAPRHISARPTAHILTASRQSASFYPQEDLEAERKVGPPAGGGCRGAAAAAAAAGGPSEAGGGVRSRTRRAPCHQWRRRRLSRRPCRQEAFTQRFTR